MGKTQRGMKGISDGLPKRCKSVQARGDASTKKKHSMGSLFLAGGRSGRQAEKKKLGKGGLGDLLRRGQLWIRGGG